MGHIEAVGQLTALGLGIARKAFLPSLSLLAEVMRCLYPV